MVSLGQNLGNRNVSSFEPFEGRIEDSLQGNRFARVGQYPRRGVHHIKEKYGGEIQYGNDSQGEGALA